MNLSVHKTSKTPDPANSKICASCSGLPKACKTCQGTGKVTSFINAEKVDEFSKIYKASSKIVFNRFK